MKTLNIILLSLLLQAGLTVSISGQGQMQGMEMKSPSVQKAICVLYPTQGNSVSGNITFTKVDGGIKVVADLQGLSKGKHGFHIHEFGDCSSADGSAAGGHFNPEGKSHGAPMEMTRHMGDMGNIDADESGKAHLEYIDTMLSLEGDHSIIGRSVILHKNEDDLKTQPTGNAGPRIACGVIGIAK
jgi:Cu-Zn family superoxide dismutase